MPEVGSALALKSGQHFGARQTGPPDESVEICRLCHLVLPNKVYGLCTRQSPKAHLTRRMITDLPESVPQYLQVIVQAGVVNAVDVFIGVESA